MIYLLKQFKMYQYSVSFTSQSGKFAVLINESPSAENAIKLAIDYVNKYQRIYYAVEATLIIYETK